MADWSNDSDWSNESDWSSIGGSGPSVSYRPRRRGGSRMARRAVARQASAKPKSTRR